MKILFYPCTVTIKQKNQIWVWYTNQDEEDLFLLDLLGKLVVARTEDELNLIFKHSNKTLMWDEASSFDLDLFWKTLKAMRPGESTPTETNALLLDGWNFIEDLCRTFGLSELVNSLNTTVIKKAYSKLFYGNNIEAITPPNREYNPIWTEDEIVALNCMMTKIWNFCLEKIEVA